MLWSWKRNAKPATKKKHCVNTVFAQSVLVKIIVGWIELLQLIELEQKGIKYVG